jgi:hypothetical protein
VIKVIRKILFWSSIGFIGLTIISLTIGQYLPFEFTDYKIQSSFYDTIIFGLPFAVLLTLFGTLKKSNTKKKNWIYGLSTITLSIICFVSQLFLIFSFGFGVWTTESIIYRHKTDNREIKYQLYDIGAFGYGGKRIVEIKPILKYWVLPTTIDTASIDKNEWNLVNEQGDIKFP